MQGLTHFLEAAQAALGRLGLATPVAHTGPANMPDAWELGELRGMSVLEPDAAAARFTRYGGATMLDFEGDGIRLWVSGPEGRQIHLIGGRQRMPPKQLLGLGAHVNGSGPVVIGPVERIRYVSTRSGEHVQYDHMCGYEFGSDYSELPVLIYDPYDQHLALVGGVYRVGRSMGILC